jgi:hypothetical protein
MGSSLRFGAGLGFGSGMGSTLRFGARFELSSCSSVSPPVVGPLARVSVEEYKIILEVYRRQTK